MRAVSDFRGNLGKTKKLELIFSREAEMKISITGLTDAHSGNLTGTVVVDGIAVTNAFIVSVVKTQPFLGSVLDLCQFPWPTHWRDVQVCIQIY